jgi:ABC-type cobalamin/Fe3+-siderophores transport system ATPase subunit
VLNNGELVRQGTEDAVLDETIIRDVFGVETQRPTQGATEDGNTLLLPIREPQYLMQILKLSKLTVMNLGGAVGLIV